MKQNLKSFIKDYKVAAFTSSSKFLIKEVLKEIDTNLNLIIEQGAGDGVMTIPLLKKLNKNGKIILVEQNKDFIKILKSIKEPRIQIFEGFAQDFKYSEKADLIISSIPFSFLKKQDREYIVKKAFENLKPGGKFIIFHQYSLLMNETVKKYFKSSKNKFVAMNFLPCFIIIGEK